MNSFLARFKAKIEHLRILRKIRKITEQNRRNSIVVRGESDVVVSLTTHGSRIERAHAAIESIVAGEIRPRRLVLWINTEPEVTSLPAELRDLQRRGLEIRQCPNYGPHTKYYPYVESEKAHQLPLVTADDDIIYPVDWLQRLLKAYEAEPQYVHCYRARRVRLGADDKLLNYRQWGFDAGGLPSFLNFATGVSGVIYPPAMLMALKFAGTQFMACCPKADDVWLHVMALRSGHRIRQLGEKSLHFDVVPFTQHVALYDSNLSGGGNDGQIAASYSVADLRLLKNELAF